MEKIIKNSIPKVNRNLIIQNFDSSTIKQKYLIILGKRQWVVSNVIYEIINSIDGKKSVNEIVRKMKDDSDLDESDTIKIINGILRSNKIIDSDEDELDSDQVKKDKNLWVRIEILKSNFIEKLTVFKLLYNKKVFPILGTIIILSQLAILVKSLTSGGMKNILGADLISIVYMFVLSFIIGISHEVGHSTAAMNYGVKPGDIGIGIYFMMPVFFSDVTNIWKIDRRKRVIVDLGGMYFQSIVTLILFIYAIIFDNNYMYIATCIITINNMNNLNPFIKLDGYWMFSDFIGIPNLHEIIKVYLKNKFKRKITNKETVLLKHFIYDIRKKEKNVFYLYLVLGTFFIIFAVYFISNMGINCYINMSNLVDTIIISEMSAIDNIKLIFKWITNNIMYTIFTVYIIKIIISYILKVIRYFKGIITRRKTVYNEYDTNI